VGLWTGREVLLIGGANGALCPPNAGCTSDGTSLADGAAFDPRTGGWRSIADAPVPLRLSPAAVAGQTAYLLPYSLERVSGLLAYEIGEDRWHEVPLPVDSDGWYQLAAGDRLVAYLGSHEGGSGEDFVYDPAAERWRPLPADPLGDSFDRTMVWTGDELVLFGAELVPNPGAEEPAVVRAAALDLATGSWRRLPDSEILSSGPWLVADGVLVNPSLGGADGGETNNWGRFYPNGGRLDPATGEWSPLPEPPAGVEYAAGAFGSSTAVYTGVREAVLDVNANRWVGLPGVPDIAFESSHTVVAAGTDLVAFGGVYWASMVEPELTNQLWIWSPTTS
jgi:hypothetical protein